MIIALMTGRNAMKIICNRQKVTRSVETLRRMITAAVKWTLLVIVLIGKDRTKWGEVDSSTNIRSRWQNILTKLPGLLAQQ